MNTLRTTSKPKLLNDVATFFGAVNKAPLKHLQDREEVPLNLVEKIQIRIETVTPLLKEVNNFCSWPHWGIND